jgi:CRP-like cAMP-binding protein
MRHDARLTRVLWWATLVDEAILREWVVNVGSRPAEVRIAHLLCEMLLRLQVVGLAADHSFELPLTQAELGETMALSAVHVSRVLQRLRREGLITRKGRTITIREWSRLKKARRV